MHKLTSMSSLARRLDTAGKASKIAYHILTVGTVRKAPHAQHPSREWVHKPLGLFNVLHVLLRNVKNPARVTAVSFQGNI